MLLVIPRIDLRGGLCEYAPTAVGRHLHRDPVAMSRLWRVQNAKTIVLVDLPPSSNLSAIGSVCDQLDIPIQVDCSQNPAADVQATFAAGAYRVVVADDTDPSSLADLGVRGQNHRFAVRTRVELGRKSAEMVRAFAEAGCLRFVADVAPGERPIREAFAALAQIALESPEAKFSIDGAVTDYPSLRMLADGAPPNVDSVVLGGPLYANKFPCQLTWCWNRPDEVALDAFTTAELRLDKPPDSECGGQPAT